MALRNPCESCSGLTTPFLSDAIKLIASRPTPTLRSIFSTVTGTGGDLVAESFGGVVFELILRGGVVVFGDASPFLSSLGGFLSPVQPATVKNSPVASAIDATWRYSLVSCIRGFLSDESTIQFEDGGCPGILDKSATRHAVPVTCS